MTQKEIDAVIEAHKMWLETRFDNEIVGEKANLREADLGGANLDFSCLPLWCGSLTANFDDRQVKQFLYHVLSVVKHSNNVSAMLKEQLLTEQNLKIAKEFHRANECGKL